MSSYLLSLNQSRPMSKKNCPAFLHDIICCQSEKSNKETDRKVLCCPIRSTVLSAQLAS